MEQECLIGVTGESQVEDGVLEGIDNTKLVETEKRTGHQTQP